MIRMNLTFEVSKEDIFQHICTTIPIDRWKEIKLKYHETRKHNIENFTPIVFNAGDIDSVKELEVLLKMVREGRKYQQIAVIYSENEREFYNFWNQLEEREKNIFGFNTHTIH